MSNKENTTIPEYTNIFMLRVVILTAACLIICFGLIQCAINISPGFYFFPFVIFLAVLEYMNKKYKLDAKNLMNLQVLTFLGIYLTSYSLVFLNLTGTGYEVSDLLPIFLGHFLHFLGAVFFSSLYAKIRSRKK